MEFPNKINFNLLERGCVDREASFKCEFEIYELSADYVHYYSKKSRSDLVITRREQYYFPNVAPKAIKLDKLDEIRQSYDQDNERESVPYQSTTMTINEYEVFITE